jgi:hypothetical protein
MVIPSRVTVADVGVFIERVEFPIPAGASGRPSASSDVIELRLGPRRGTSLCGLRRLGGQAEMAQDLGDHGSLGDAGGQHHLSTTLRAVEKIVPKRSTHEFRPLATLMLGCRCCAILGLGGEWFAPVGDHALTQACVR